MVELDPRLLILVGEGNGLGRLAVYGCIHVGCRVSDN
jgi:hypothetical protein